MAILDRISNIFGNTLFYPGCYAKYKEPKIGRKYEEILKKLEIKFLTIEEFKCCGKISDELGYYKVYGEIINKNREILKKYNIKKIITSCDQCYKAFREDYEIKTEHIKEIIFENIKSFERLGGNITYHVNCHDENEKISKLILNNLGFKIETINECCGNNAGLKENAEAIANKIADNFLTDTKTNLIVTSCPKCYLHLKENAKGKQIKEFSEVLECTKV